MKSSRRKTLKVLSLFTFYIIVGSFLVNLWMINLKVVDNPLGFSVDSLSSMRGLATALIFVACVLLALAYYGVGEKVEKG